MLDTLGLVRQRLSVARASSVRARLNSLLVAHDGLTHAEIEAIGQRVLEQLEADALEFIQAQVPPQVSHAAKRMSDRCTFGRPYHSPPGQTGFSIRVTCDQPVQASADSTPMLGIADDVNERYVFTVIDANRPGEPPLQIRLDEVHPSVTEAGRLNIETWAQTAIGIQLAELARGIRQGLAARGYSQG